MPLRGANGRFVKTKNNGYDALIKRMVDAQQRRTVTVGVHETEGSAPEGDGDITVAEVGAIHELGLGGQEERSFIRAYVDENEQSVNDSLRKIGQAIVKGTVPSVDIGLERFGLMAVGGMQKRISDGGVTPPDKPATIARKGSSTTLIDTGVLRSSITHKVEK